eukprot:Gregarina_sp_Poly_1__4734@NODE_252_length_10633_cov_239_890119_g220_i0_p1_GENE_NODE_252_length_10633_cov_239_890119_g220_i0NODE_252_length_10633_cov_239_890119_g220_i0_p1_ORF_typecomplete_len736_score137_84Vps53_N/PF04100_12/7_2e65Nup88/PF10168_9/0_12BRE1/PF08647_11/1_3e02BRE1/PF08647_11/0_76BRE1/PF08647_11/1_7e02YabA/PF06156_13/11YabA/PF06156_13/9Suppressor_APC/PF11414_8/1e04Suppressor_APC/PF11414_8/0_2FCH/PF00611_23/0_53FCH/PF00611_23/8_2e03IL12/PF03039_14/1_2MCPsignal/PF00015_21/0_96Spc24/PF0
MKRVGDTKAEAIIAKLQNDEISELDIIDECFPDERSLECLDECLVVLEKELSKVTTEIKRSIHQQCMKANDLTTAWKELKDRAEELAKDMAATAETASKASSSTDKVFNEIRLYDQGKTNVVATISILQRVLMSEEALEKLRDAVARKDHKSCADLIQALKSLSEFLLETKVAADVPQIQAVLKDKESLLDSLKMQIIDDLAAVIDGDVSDKSPEEVAHMCEAADALSPSIRHEILFTMAMKLLEPYKRNFCIVDTSYGEQRKQDCIQGLEQIERRFYWLKKSLENCKNRYDSLPRNWRPEAVICQQFTLVSRQHLVEILEGCFLEVEAAVLMNCIKKVKEFEEFLANHYEGFNTPTGFSFIASISPVFDSFFGGWYKQKEAALKNLISSVCSSSESSALGDGEQGEGMPRKFYREVLSVVEFIRVLDKESEHITSREFLKLKYLLVKKAISGFVDSFLLAKIESNSKKLSLSSNLRTLFSQTLKLNCFGEPNTKNVWRGRLPTSKSNSSELEIGILFSCFSTIQFIEMNLPSLEALLNRGGSCSESLDPEAESLWRAKSRVLGEVLKAYSSTVVIELASKPFLEIMKSSTVRDGNMWMSNFVRVWTDFERMCSDFVSPSVVQLIFDYCGCILVTALADSLNDLMVSGTPLNVEHSVLDLSTLRDLIRCNFPRSQIIVEQLEILITVIKYIGSQLRENDNLKHVDMGVIWKELQLQESRSLVSLVFTQTDPGTDL